MNNKAQKSGVLGFALVALVFVFFMTLFATLEPFKEFLDTARDTTSLNCRGTTNFNQTAFDEQNDFEKLVTRPTCAVTGFAMVYFFGAFMIAAIVWLFDNWRRISK